MEQPSISRIVRQLEREGLVRRKVSTEDSRVVYVSLTAAGEKAFKQICRTPIRRQERALNGFSAKEIDKLTDFLRRIQDKIEANEWAPASLCSCWWPSLMAPLPDSKMHIDVKT